MDGTLSHYRMFYNIKAAFMQDYQNAHPSWRFTVLTLPF